MRGDWARWDPRIKASREAPAASRLCRACVCLLKLRALTPPQGHGSLHNGFTFRFTVTPGRHTLFSGSQTSSFRSSFAADEPLLTVVLWRGALLSGVFGPGAVGAAALAAWVVLGAGTFAALAVRRVEFFSSRGDNSNVKSYY